MGDPLTGQASVILTTLKNNLNQVPITGENGETIPEPNSMNEKVKYIGRKFVANGRFLNLNLLTNLGQLLVQLNKVSNDIPNPAGVLGMRNEYFYYINPVIVI